MIRHIRILVAAAALLTGSAAEAAAQFTGVVTPPPPTRREQAATARSDSAARLAGVRDSANNATRLTDMKTWVDSATVALAGTAGAARATGDTTALDSTGRSEVAAGRRRGARGAAAAEATMHDGARAPDTATPLPTIGLLGVFGIGAGLVLMGRRRRA
jgi:hypothetical protein